MSGSTENFPSPSPGGPRGAETVGTSDGTTPSTAAAAAGAKTQSPGALKQAKGPSTVGSADGSTKATTPSTVGDVPVIGPVPTK